MHDFKDILQGDVTC